MTAADAYHCCIMDIMNAATCLRLDSPDLKGLNGLTLEPECHTNQMTAADAYHCCIMDIMNDATWLRLDSPDLKGLNGLTLEPKVGEDYT
eukprot:scaffold35584_cov71-Cyclotella_meneghiniana.AAC.2